MCVGEENISREKGVCWYDLAECENIENTYLVSCTIANCALLIVLGNEDGVKIPALPVGLRYL